MDDKTLLMVVGTISTVLLGITILMQIARKKYREATINLIYVAAFFCIIYGTYVESPLISFISVCVLIPVTVVQFLFARKDYKGLKTAEKVQGDK